MSDREIDSMAKNLKLILDPAIVMFALNTNGDPVGFALALPDLNGLIKEIDGKLFPTGFLKLLFGLFSLGDILDHGDEKFRFARVLPQQRYCDVYPDN